MPTDPIKLLVTLSLIREIVSFLVRGDLAEVSIFVLFRGRISFGVRFYWWKILLIMGWRQFSSWDSCPFLLIFEAVSSLWSPTVLPTRSKVHIIQVWTSQEFCFSWSLTHSRRPKIPQPIRNWTHWICCSSTFSFKIWNFH